MWGTNLKRLTALLALLPSSLPSFLFSSSRMMLLKVWKKKQTRNFRNHHIFLTFQHYYIFDRTEEFLKYSLKFFPCNQSWMWPEKKAIKDFCNGLPLKYCCYYHCRYIWRSRNGARRRLRDFWMECMVILFSDLWQRNFNEDPKFSSRGKGPNVGMWQANGAEGNVFSTYSPLRR